MTSACAKRRMRYKQDKALSGQSPMSCIKAVHAPQRISDAPSSPGRKLEPHAGPCAAALSRAGRFSPWRGAGQKTPASNQGPRGFEPYFGEPLHCLLQSALRSAVFFVRCLNPAAGEPRSAARRVNLPCRRTRASSLHADQTPQQALPGRGECTERLSVRPRSDVCFRNFVDMNSSSSSLEGARTDRSSECGTACLR